LLGETARAAEDFEATIELGLPAGAFEDVFIAYAHLALLAARRGAWGEAGRQAQAAQDLVEAHALGEYSTAALAHVVSARVALHEGRREAASATLVRAHRLRPLLDHGLPWLTVEVGIELVRAHLALGEVAAARTVLTETERVIERRPDLGSLVAELRELGERVTASSGPTGAWAMSLTGAELRLLPYLATHLTIPEIATRLFISRNTVKTEAVSIYRKLGASSRSEAIEHAVDLGLLESSVYPPRANLIQRG
jgi:LuxR family maltose regulon positive regulatory protein